MKNYPIACLRCDRVIAEEAKDPWGYPRQLCADCETKVRAREQELFDDYHTCPSCRGLRRADDHELCGLCEDCCALQHNLGREAGR